MTQTAMLLGDDVVGASIERQARAHAARYGLTFLRVEMGRGLFGPEEMAVFRRSGGGEVRRTAEMMAQALQD